MRVKLTTTALATVTEEWIFDVPEGTDLTDLDAVLSLLNDDDTEVLDVENVDVSNEEDRQAVAVAPFGA